MGTPRSEVLACAMRGPQKSRSFSRGQPCIPSRFSGRPQGLARASGGPERVAERASRYLLRWRPGQRRCRAQSWPWPVSSL
eukprot:180205-Pyramimonas_sp.AAC.1